VWYFLELFQQCGIFWSCSNSVVFLELFQQCGIFCFSFYYSLSSAILVYTTFVSDQLLTTPNFNNS
jgi:hypothetical protein